MVSGAGRKVFQPGEVLTASNVQNYLQDQAVMVFAGTAARGTALGAGTVTDGMMSYLQDSNSVEVYKTSGTAISGWEAPYPVSPNAIINGDFSINQRAFTSTTTDGYGFDRWIKYSSGGTVTYSAQTFTPGTAPVVGYEAANYARIVTSGQSAAGDYAQFAQHIEDVRTFAGQTVTVSFWARAGSGTPKIAVELYQDFGSGGSPSSDVDTYAGQVTLSTSWARYSITAAIPSIAGKTIGTTANSSALLLVFWSSAGSTYNARTGSIGIQNNTIDIWGVQVEAGSTATPFRRNANSIQGELAACQRYYHRITANGVYGLLAQGWAYLTTAVTAWQNFKVPMRIMPTSIEYSNVELQDNYSNVPAITNIALTTALSNEHAGNITISVASGLTVAKPYGLSGNNNSAGYLAFNAEL